ncbi:MAG: pectinesterase family protein [Oscillospiraceae bacterium]
MSKSAQNGTERNTQMNEIRITTSDKLSDVLKNVTPHTRIVLPEGTFREKFEISTPDIEIVGAGLDKTVIVNGDYAKKIASDGREFNTFRTYTVAVTAPNVTLRNLTIENDARRPEKLGQEVALTVYADNFLAENCAFISTQDTIFCGPLPEDLIARYKGFLLDSLRTSGSQKQIFRDCLVAGTVDFIFGCGDTLFDSCEIKSLCDARGHGYVAAPSHSAEQEIGIVFNKCRLTREEGVADGSIYLARPWRDYGKTSFIDCEMDSHIAAEGFNKWGDSHRDRTARFAEYPVKPECRVPWSTALTEAEAKTLLDYFK